MRFQLHGAYVIVGTQIQSVVQDTNLGKRKRKKRQQVQIPDPDGEDWKLLPISTDA